MKDELPVERFILGIVRRPQAKALVAKHGFTPNPTIRSSARPRRSTGGGG